MLTRKRWSEPPPTTVREKFHRASQTGKVWEKGNHLPRRTGGSPLLNPRFALARHKTRAEQLLENLPVDRGPSSRLKEDLQYLLSHFALK